MTFIVWQGDAYLEVKASPPNHRFGVEMSSYSPSRETEDAGQVVITPQEFHVQPVIIKPQPK
jgi:hypothetical protein